MKGEIKLTEFQQRMLVKIAFGIDRFFFKQGERHHSLVEEAITMLVGNDLIEVHEPDTNRFQYLPTAYGYAYLHRTLDALEIAQEGDEEEFEAPAPKQDNPRRWDFVVNEDAKRHTRAGMDELKTMCGKSILYGRIWDDDAPARCTPRCPECEAAVKRLNEQEESESENDGKTNT